MFIIYMGFQFSYRAVLFRSTCMFDGRTWYFALVFHRRIYYYVARTISIWVQSTRSAVGRSVLSSPTFTIAKTIVLHLATVPTQLNVYTTWIFITARFVIIHICVYLDYILYSIYMLHMMPSTQLTKLWSACCESFVFFLGCKILRKIKKMYLELIHF